jgi:hypothetical protein
MSDTIQSLRKQLADAEENLRIIEERLSEFVLSTDPANLQLIKEKRHLEERIADLHARLDELLRTARLEIEGQGSHVAVLLEGEDLRPLELAYLDDLARRYEFWRDHYTPLTGIAEVRAAIKDGPRLDLPMPFVPRGFEKLLERGYGPPTEMRRVPVEDLRGAVAEHRRIILLGDPGSGKTTTLWRLAYDYASAARENGQLPLPLLVPLGEYTDDSSFEAHVTRYLGPLGTYLPTYLTSGRLMLFLDGLNEMPQTSCDRRIGRIQAVLDRCAGGTAIVTCRALDYVVRLKGLQRVEISPLDQGRIRAFLHSYLGQTAGEQLFWALCGGDEMRKLWDTWEGAGGTWDQFWSAEKMPDQVFGATTVVQDELWDSLRRQTPLLLSLGSNPYLLLMTAQVYAGAGGRLPPNRARLFGAFVDTLLQRERERCEGEWIQEEIQQDGLAALAYAMQVEGGQGTTVDRRWALERLCQAVPDCDAERLLYLASSATLLDTGDATVRFYHQLLQEYFAARG